MAVVHPFKTAIPGPSTSKTYESLACNGEMMTTAVMTTYVYNEIDQARIDLNAVSK